MHANLDLRGGSNLECPHDSVSQSQFSSKLGFWSCNTSGLAGVWKLIRLLETLAQAERPEAILVQEARCNSHQLTGVMNSMAKMGYNTFSSGCVPKKSKGRAGVTMIRGVLTFVASTCRCTKVGSETLSDSQCLLLSINDILVINSYAPPGDESQRLQAEQVHRLFRQADWRSDWVACGDWNAPYLYSWIATFSNLEGGGLLDMSKVKSSRWNSQRLIDYPMSSFSRTSQCTTRLEKISDHKILQWELPCNVPKLTEFRFPSKPQWNQPAWLEAQRWRQLFDEAWGHGVSSHWHAVLQEFSELHPSPATLDPELDHTQNMVDFTWQLCMSKMAFASRHAHQYALFEIPEHWNDAKEVRRVEHLANAKWQFTDSFKLKGRQLPRSGTAQSMKFRKHAAQLGRSMP